MLFEFAFGTREGLVPPVRTNADPIAMRALDVEAPFHKFQFDLTLNSIEASEPATDFDRARAAT